MIATFDIQDMTCGHCASTITKAVKAVDPAAKIAIDLPTHRVQVDSAKAADEIAAAIREEGYTPVAAAA